MQFINLISLIGILTIITNKKLYVEARRIKLRPLTAPEVYRILKEAGREDAVPEGRVITQGIAAMTGFALGATTGIGGALLFDLIMANLTGSSSSTSSTNTTVSFITQDICFQSRSIKSDIQAESDDEDDESSRQISVNYTTNPTAPPPSTTTPTQTAPPTTTNPGTTPTGTTGTVPTGTNPTQTATQTGTGEEQTCISIQKPKSRKRRSTGS